jgi:hypothetical protein
MSNELSCCDTLPLSAALARIHAPWRQGVRRLGIEAQAIAKWWNRKRVLEMCAQCGLQVCGAGG